jgi:tellurite resistance protein
MEAASRALPRTIVGGVPLSEPERHRAYIATAQRDLNRHRRRLGATEELAVDGEWDEHTETAFREICRVLGLAPERNVRTFRLIAGAAEALTDAEQALAGGDGAGFAQQLRERFASEAARLHPLSEEERERAYVAALQRDLNRHLVRRGEPPRVLIDGKWDPQTDAVFRAVCEALKIEPERTVRTYRLIAGAAARPIRARSDLVVLGGRSLPRAQREQAFIAAVQRDLNQHLVRLGSPGVLAVDGEWGEHTARAFRRVCKVLGVEAARAPRTYRVIAGALAPRTETERKRATTDGAAFERKLRRHFAKQTVVVRTPTPQPAPGTTPDPGGHGPGGKQPARERHIAAVIDRHGGRYAEHIIAASARTGVKVSLICAVLEQETHFSNVFGHDEVANPIKSPLGSNRPVTEELYKQYRRFRDQGLGCQGVGPMQLTSKFLQEAADKQGGCWRVGPNIRVGVAHLATCIKQSGSVRGGLVRYNGGSSYPDAVLPLQRKWQQRLGAAAGAVPRAPRTFRVTSPRMKGDDVLAFQRVLNKRFAAWRVPATLGEDGEFGPETRRAARQVARGLGLAAGEYEHGITLAVRVLIRNPSRRTPDQRARFTRQAGFRKQLRAARARDLAAGQQRLDEKKALPTSAPAGLRGRAYTQARELVGVMEKGGDNRGKKVEQIIRFAQGTLAEEWCVDFLIWCYGHAGSTVVRPGYTRAVRFMLAPGVVSTRAPQRGDMVRFTFDHTGMFVKDNGNGTITTIEGNTTGSGAVSASSTGGQGVYLKIRSKTGVRDYLRVTR